MTSPQTFNELSPRTQAYAIAPLLKRHDAGMIFEKFGQVYVLPKGVGVVAKFRRYEALPLVTTALVEGVTPSGNKPTYTDYIATLQEFGQFIPYTGFMTDVHEDPILQVYGSLCIQQAAESMETVRYGVLKAGTQVGFANGSARTDVNTVLTTAGQRVATAALWRQRGLYLTEMVSSDARFRTEPIEAAFVAVVHPNLASDVRNMQGFISTKQYGTVSSWQNEIGSVDDVRYVRSILAVPFADGGGAKGAMRSTTGTSADVYPVLYFSKDAYGIVPLKGVNAMTLIAHNPGSAGSADALNQRGTLGWKTATVSVILNDNWIYRHEVACTA